MKLRSEDLKAFLQAFKKAQENFGSAKKDGKNPHFKSSYATLASVIDACKEHLNSEGITISSSIEYHDGNEFLVTYLEHDESGQYKASASKLTPDRGGLQAYGSAISYLRRYQLSALTGLATEDDDGETAQKPFRKHSKPSSLEDQKKRLSPEQVDNIEGLLVDKEKSAKTKEWCMKNFNSYDFAYMPVESYERLIAKLRSEQKVEATA